MLQQLPNCDYIRPTTWIGGERWSVNKTVIQTDRTTFPANLLDEFKAFARIDAPDEDAYFIRTTLPAAIEAVEHFTGLQINPQERQWAVRDWQYPNVLQVHGQPVQTVVVQDTLGNDISADCEINANVEDVMWYIRIPQEYRDFNIVFGCGLYWDAATGPNIWTVANVWGLLNVWSVPEATLDNNPLLKQAILITAVDMYENRTSHSVQQQYKMPSIAEMVLRPLRRPVEF